jgi:chromosome segregation protein
MDKGAHFYRCDFQVHTPRDHGWDGARPVSDEDRRAFATAFVEACREKGIDAVAITDHHDFGFYQFFREAAENETRGGKLVPEDERIIVFPGLELTLGVPCQAILILDPDFPLSLLPAVCSALALQPNDPSDPKHAEVAQLSHIRDLMELYKRLEEQPCLKGRYIVLPNVTPEGYRTLHRNGFLSHYKTMPFVGGYIDGDVSRLSLGDWRILNGEIDAYGNKSIGLFCTSDSRQADFAKLGLPSTWVKWAKPTAEAIRQACLAKATRISHVEPETPSLVIDSMHVSNSKFLGPIDLELNKQFNCLIGGRGTGKSTILEYLRWALCDQTPPFLQEEELPDFQAKRHNLIQKTLLPHSVDVNFIVNGVRHTVRRKSDTQEILLRVATGTFQQVSDDDVRRLLSIDAYSQKQLSSVGVRTEELLRFIETPIKKQLEELRGSSEDLKASIRANYALIDRKRQLGFQIRKAKIELESQTKQLESIREQLRNLSGADRAVLAQHDKYLVEDRLLANWGREADQLAVFANEGLASLKNLPTAATEAEKLENAELIQGYHTRVAAAFESARKLLGEIADLAIGIEANDGDCGKMRSTWKAKHEAHEKQYAEIKEKASSQQKLLELIAETEKRVKDLQEDIAKKEATFTTQGAPEAGYTEARRQWEGLFKTIGDMLEARCISLTELSSGTLRVRLRRGAGIKKMAESLTSILEKSGIRQQAKKVEDLCADVALATSPTARWTAVLGELEKLALVERGDAGTKELPECPILGASGFNAGDCERIAERMTVDRWVDLSMIELEDEPVFEYRQREGDYIRFRDASAGQQATVLLRILLNQKGPPLIIDQPEEDLDNEIVLKIVEEIWKAKKNRQIILTSHNANIVVNGDADLVIVCAYRQGTEQSGGCIKLQGAIDVATIRKEITTIMEGGRDAFRLRKEKYGF